MYIEQTDSTNSLMQRILRGEEPQYAACLKENIPLIYTTYQTAGRGQTGNGWESEQGKNLLFSILAHPHNINVREQFYISEAIALAVSDSVIDAAGPEYAPYFSVKWSNDIYYKDYKMAGILIENTLQGDRIMDTVVGVGLDVNQEMFLSDAPNPVSLKNITGKDYDRDKLLADIIDRFIGYMELSEQQRHKVDKLYRERLYRREGYHKFRDANGCFEACIEGIQPNGCLMLQTIDGEHRVYEFKQVQFILPGK